MTNPSEEKLRALWAATLPGTAIESSDPGATYKAPDAALTGARTVGAAAPSRDMADMGGTTLGAGPAPSVDQAARTLPHATPAPMAEMTATTLAGGARGPDPRGVDAMAKTLAGPDPRAADMSAKTVGGPDPRAAAVDSSAQTVGAPAPPKADSTSRTLTAAPGMPPGSSPAGTGAQVPSKSGRGAGATSSVGRLTLPTIHLAPKGGAAAEAGPTGSVPPTYELLDEIGRGGMGVVYRAKQGSLQRQVAVKRTLGGKSAAAREPFVAEALVTGLLDHPNIVPVHELGATEEGEVFLAMKLVDGAPWNRLLHPRKDRPEEVKRSATLGLEDHLAILIDVCNAIAFAHERGFVHCDLKPENVMVGAFGEVVVMDWGVAVAFGDNRPDGSGVVRHASEIVRPCGTPVYMPPELAEGRGAEIGAATDVYLLGAILHEVITGKPPHGGNTLLQVLLASSESKPPVYGPEVPEELQGIARRAMAAEPKARFPRAAEFQDALKAHLKHRESIAIERAAHGLLQRATTSGEPVRAVYSDLAEALAGFRQARVLWEGNEAAKAGERAARIATARAALEKDDLGLAQVQADELGSSSEEGRSIAAKVLARRAEIEAAARHARLLRRGIVASVIVALISLTAGYVLVRGERDRANESAAEARRQAEIATAARAESQRKLARSLLAEGDALERTGKAGQARDRFESARGVLSELGMPVFAADLGVFAADRAAPRPLATYEVDGGARAVALATTQPWLLVADGRGRLQILRRSTGEVVRTVPCVEGPASALAVAWGGTRALLASADGTARAVDLESGLALAPLGRKGGPGIRAVSVSPDGRTGILARDDGAIAHVDLETGREIGVMKAREPGTPRPSEDGGLRERAKGHKGPVLAAFISPNGTVVYSAGEDGTAQQWHLGSCNNIWTFEGAKGPLRGVALTYDGCLLTGGDDRSLRVYKVESGMLERERHLEMPAGPVTAIAISPDAKTAIVASQDRTIRIFDVEEEEAGEGDDGAEGATPRRKKDAVIRRLDDPEGPTTSMSLSADDALLATVGRDGKVRLIDLARAAKAGEVGLEVRLLGEPTAARQRRRDAPASGPVALLAGGAVAVTAGEKGTILARDPRSGRVLSEVAPSAEVPVAICAGSSDTRALLAYADGALAEVDVASGKVERSRPKLALAAGAALASLAIAPEGKRAVGVLADGKALLVDGTSGAVVAPLSWPSLTRGAVALVSDGMDALVGTSDGAVRMLEVRAPDDPRPMKDAAPRVIARHDAPVRAIALLPGMPRYAASGGEDATVRILDLEAGAEVRALAVPGPVISLSAAATPDGILLLAGLADGRAALLDLARPAIERALAAALPAPAARGRLLAHHGAFDLAAEALSAEGGAPLAPDPLPPLERARLCWERGDLLGARHALAGAAPSEGAPAWLLDATRGRIEQDLERQGSAVGRSWDILRDVAVTPDGKRAIAAGRENVLRCFSLETALPAWSTTVSGELYFVSVSPDGKLVATGGRDDSLQLLDAASGRLLRTITMGADVRTACFADGGRLVAAVAYEGAVRAFDTSSGSEVASFALPEGARIQCLDADPRGTRAVAGVRSGELHVMDLAHPGEAPRVLPAPVTETGVDDVRILPGSKQALVRASWTLRIVDLDTGAIVRDVGDGHLSLQSIAVSSDGKRAIVGSDNGMAVLFDLTTGKSLRALRGHRGYVLGGAFAGDGTAVTCATDGWVRAQGGSELLRSPRLDEPPDAPRDEGHDVDRRERRVECEGERQDRRLREVRADVPAPVVEGEAMLDAPAHDEAVPSTVWRSSPPGI